MAQQMKQPHRGAIAICSNGSVGLITSNTKVPVPMPDNPDYQAWTGIQICPSEVGKTKNKRVVGDTWCSSDPTVIFTAQEMEKLGKDALDIRAEEKAYRLVETIRQLHTPDKELLLIRDKTYRFETDNGTIVGTYCYRREVKGCDFEFFDVNGRTLFFYPSELKNLTEVPQSDLVR
jgi:hypothetical protein